MPNPDEMPENIGQPKAAETESTGDAIARFKQSVESIKAQPQDKDWGNQRPPAARDALGIAQVFSGSDREIMADMNRIFVYHAPQGTQTQRYGILREEAKKLAELIILNCPHSRERSAAITHLQSAIMFANAAIAIRE